MSKNISFEELKSRLKPALDEIEKERLKLKTKVTNNCVIGGVIILALLFLIGSQGGEFHLILIFGIIGFFLIYIISTTGKKNLSDYYKEHIITPFVEALLENGKYEPDNGISRSTFIESGLFINPDRYSSEDLMYGNVGKTTLSFSEVHAEERRTTRNSRGQTTNNYVDIFRGFILVADFHKNFKERTIVSRKSFSLWNRNRVKLEDPEFEKRFNVYSKDQIEARYILSTSMMSRITELDNKFNNKVQISFVNSNVIVAINSSTNYFEFNLWQSVHNEFNLREEYYIIETLVSIVEDLNLNTRIWSKE